VKIKAGWGDDGTLPKPGKRITANTTRRGGASTRKKRERKREGKGKKKGHSLHEERSKKRGGRKNERGEGAEARVRKEDKIKVR